MTKDTYIFYISKFSLVTNCIFFFLVNWKITTHLGEHFQLIVDSYKQTK